MKKAGKEEEEGLSNNTAKSARVKNINLETDFPLSEKDEVKKAEEKMRKKNK